MDSDEVAWPRISSTSVIRGTGFMKCIPSTLSGRLVAAPSVVIEMDEVLDARMTWPRQGVETGEQGALGVFVLDDRFDDVVGAREGIDAGAGGEATNRGIALVSRELALLNELVEALLDRRPRPVECR